MSIIRGDAQGIPLSDGCVQCVVTSPPYFGLRDYRIKGQLGLEATPEAYLDTMVAVFRQIKRVLRDDGTVWCNIGDNFADKQLQGMPWRLAFALQADGWYLRSDIIWAKPNPMPESVLDRPTRSHEYIFLLAKRSSYYYDADAIREPHTGPPIEHFGKRSRLSGDVQRLDGVKTWEVVGKAREYNPNGRNRRDVWTIPTQATPEAHFATFPEKLVEPCVLAGTSAKGCCSKCGAPYVRETAVDYTVQSPISEMDKARNPSQGNNFATRALGRATKLVETLGWRATCTHDAAIQPCLVFDPFLGSGTVGIVCERLGRRWCGLELSAEYIGIATERTRQRGLFAQSGGA